MRRATGWLIIAGIVACAQVASAASPILITQSYYVAPHGYDGSDGTSPATAFGSVTRAAAVIGTAAQTGFRYELFIAPGEYRTNQVLFMNLTAPIDVIGDTVGAVFSLPGGPIWFNADAASPAVVTLYNVRSMSWSNIHLNKLALASSTNDRVLECYGSIGVALKNIGITSSSTAPVSYGILLGADCVKVAIEGATVSRTGEGISNAGALDVRITNCWIYRNTTGLGIGDPANTEVVNNLIHLNAEYGVRLSGACPGTVLFNNIICDNGITGSGGQIWTNFSPLLNAGSSVPGTWRSAFNVIGGTTQAFGLVTQGMTDIPIPNQKIWMQQTGQDLWGSSHDGQVYYSVNAPMPSIPDEIGGYGAPHFSGVTAPAEDYFGRARPQAVFDLGCTEQNESAGLYFHHPVLSAAPATGLPRQAVDIAVSLCTPSGAPVGAPLPLTFYAYLQGGSAMTAVDPLGRIAGTGVTVAPDFDVPGLYRISGLVPAAFTLHVLRDSDASSAQTFTLRMVEWPDWASTSAGTHGGRAAALNSLRWLTIPSAGLSQVEAESPVVASGRDGALITIQVSDGSGQPITGLMPADFTVAFTGNGALSPISEDPLRPGWYSLRLSSSDVGVKSVRVTALGIVLADQPQISFVSGVFGDVRALANGDPLTGIRLALTAADGSRIGGAESAAGTYSIPVAQPVAEPYVLTAEDPAGALLRTAYTVRVTAAQAVRQDVLLGAPAAAVFAGYAFPNPAPRGSTVTLVSDLPQPGRLRLDLFDLRGRRIGTLINTDRPAGRSQTLWRAANRFGENLAPGVYLLLFQCGGAKTTAKLVITP